MVSITEISDLEPIKIRSICTQKKMESKCVFTFLQVRSFTLMHPVCWSRLFRQIVGADAAPLLTVLPLLQRVIVLKVSVSVSRLKIMTTE